MTLPTRPDVNDFIDLTNQLADAKTTLSELEWEFEKAKAQYIKETLSSNVPNKSRAVDYAKVIGNDEKQGKYLDGLMSRIRDVKRTITILYGKIEAWKSNKDLYRTDSYHQVTGSHGVGSWLGDGE